MLDLLDSLIHRARARGRAGGAVILVVGLALLGAGIFGFQLAWNADGPWYSPLGMGLALVLDVLGVALSMFGGTLLWKGQQGVVMDRRRKADPMALSRVLARLDVEPRPYFVCTRCPAVLPQSCAGTCPDCGTSAECIEVRIAEDIPLVRAALE